MAEAERDLDNLPVRIGAPHGLVGLADSVQSPIFATAVGLALRAAEDRAWAMPGKASDAPWWEAIKGWADGLLARARSVLR